MSRTYDSLKGVLQDTFERNKANAGLLARLKGSNASSLTDEMEKLERLLVDGISRFKAAVKEGEAVVAAEAQHAEQVAESLRVNIAALEAKVRETEDTVRREESAHQKAEESLSAKIHDLQNEVKKKEEALENRANEVSDLKSNIDGHLKHIAQLELAVQKHAKRAEHVTESSKAKLAALEVQVRDKEEIVNKKDSKIKHLDQTLTAKIKDFESQMRNKEELLAARDAEISDLKSQLKSLTKGINEMSSFFKHAESLAAVEGKAVSTAVLNKPLNGGEEKPAPFQSKHPKVTPIIPDAARQMVSSDLFRRITGELTQILGPMAPIIIREHVVALGESMEKFPKTRLPELFEILSKEISDENVKSDFRERFAQNE